MDCLLERSQFVVGKGQHGALLSDKGCRHHASSMCAVIAHSTWPGHARARGPQHAPRCMQVYLKHEDTGVFLADTGRAYGRPINGQHEIAGLSKKDTSAGWQASYGMYLHTSNDEDPPAASDNHTEL